MYDEVSNRFKQTMALANSAVSSLFYISFVSYSRGHRSYNGM